MIEYDEAAIRAAVSPAAMRSAMQRAFVDSNRDEVWSPPRVRWCHRDPETTILLMGASSSALRISVLKQLRILTSNVDKGLPAIQGELTAFDRTDGSVIARFDAETITLMRTAACSAVATDQLAQPQASTLAIFGTGPQAREHLSFMKEVRPINRVLLYGRNSSKTAQIGAEWSRDFSLPVLPQPDLSQLIDADIICTATSALEPLFTKRDIAEKVHINAIGSYRADMCEVHSDVVRSSHVVVDNLHECAKGAGELIRSFGDEVALHVREMGDQLSITETVTEGATLYKAVGHASQDLFAVAAVLAGAAECIASA